MLIVFWLPVEAVFGLPVEMAFWLPVEPIGTVLACLAGGAFSFSLAMVALGVPSLAWTCSVLSTLLCSLFSLGVGVILTPTVLVAWPFSCVPFYSFFGVLPRVSCPLAFFCALVCSFSSLLEEVSSSAKIRMSSSLDIFQKISQERGTV